MKQASCVRLSKATGSGALRSRRSDALARDRLDRHAGEASGKFAAGAERAEARNMSLGYAIPTLAPVLP
jgi:hypothetical protein